MRCYQCGRFVSERAARWFDYEWYCSDACEEPARGEMAATLARRRHEVFGVVG
jgi:hypothetical protein